MTMDDRLSVRHGQIHTPGHPGLASLHQQGRNQAQAGGLVGEDAHHARAATYLPIQAFDHVRGANKGAGGEEGDTA